MPSLEITMNESESKTKAGSKAEKRRKRRGRPRLMGVMREPNGRRSRRKRAVIFREEQSEKEMQSVAIEARIRQGIPRAYAHLPEAGSALGRVGLMFPGRVSHCQTEAGERFAIDYARYYALSGIPFPSTRSADLFRLHGINHHDDPERAKKAANRIMELERVLGLADSAGRPTTRLVKQVCIMNDDSQMRFEHMVKFLTNGLEALVTFYGIERKT